MRQRFVFGAPLNEREQVTADERALVSSSESSTTLACTCGYCPDMAEGCCEPCGPGCINAPPEPRSWSEEACPKCKGYPVSHCTCSEKVIARREERRGNAVIEPRTQWMTREEEEAWLLIADAANAMFRLPVLHSSDNEETVRDIHNLQNRLLARAAYSAIVGS